MSREDGLGISMAHAHSSLSLSSSSFSAAAAAAAATSSFNRSSLHFPSASLISSPDSLAVIMRFQTLIAVALPALVLGAPTPQDPEDTFPEDAPNDSIVGGTAASAGDFPFIVSLQVGGSHYCGGSILNSDTIVTAAHCSVPKRIGPVNELRVRLGSLVRFAPLIPSWYA